MRTGTFTIRVAALTAAVLVRFAAVAGVSNHVRFPYVGAISADAETGKVLFCDGERNEAYIASVSKLMTALLVLEDVATGKYSLADHATATPDVYYSEASWVGIRVGQSMTVDDLLMALLVHSANDAAIVLGVHSAGSLETFVARMNSRAKELGMNDTEYFNPNGLPPGGPPKSRTRYPWKKFNRSTAADQLKLALEIVNRHPEMLKYTSTKVAKGIVGGDGKPLQSFINHNNVMVKDKMKIINPDGSEAVDGLKTGYIDAGGSSIVITGKRGGKRAIAVVLGSGPQLDGNGKVLKRGGAVRDEAAKHLLDDALGSLVW